MFLCLTRMAVPLYFIFLCSWPCIYYVIGCPCVIWIVVLMMAGSSAESLTLKDAFTNWLSITALRHIPPDQKSVFRKLEKLELKIIRLEGHLEFNQACIRNKLLPTYTNFIMMHRLMISFHIFPTPFILPASAITVTRNKFTILINLQYCLLLLLSAHVSYSVH